MMTLTSGARDIPLKQCISRPDSLGFYNLFSVKDQAMQLKLGHKSERERQFA